MRRPIDVRPLIADPHGTLATLRETGPVHRVQGADGNPAWLVTRYEDVRRALADPRLSLDKRNATPGNYAGLSLPPALDANLLNMDPPDHTRVRRLVVKAFTPGRVEKLREPVRRLADGLLDAVEPAGSADLLAAYAGPLPIMVMCDLLGIPEERRLDFRAWTDALITPDPARPEAAREAVGSMIRFFAGLLAAKRAEPADDLLSDLIAVRDGSDRLSEDELTSLAFLLLFAGYENTVHLIANSVLALLDHPEELRTLRKNPDGLAAAVEELNRWDGPGPLAIRRFPLEDVEIGGVTVPAGETVLLSLASANRDPARFPDPDRLDLRRNTSGSLALGHGIHYCLGAALGRMETETALAALLERFEKLELAVPREELKWRPSIRARGLISLPVRWSATSRTRF
ncbi:MULTISPECIES: cytochrome P450 family protein [Streptomyces]|uniref:cytochrome P450 family protein n=1 Tax=Streptomyces TaxID=1883 RepID=UPI00163BD45F|nr:MULTISPECIES: cytochrome P450 [Streptomyces]MBC2876199.1 cytochrome P450 [Streptomyces sp. TYQ1024]UBI35575.1 cytochrome P450 [Streptomyces mobaraensis]UKW28170.1 cytochrome P450 [Streptomyces sp. TYQ1024]